MHQPLGLACILLARLLFPKYDTAKLRNMLGCECINREYVAKQHIGLRQEKKSHNSWSSINGIMKNKFACYYLNVVVFFFFFIRIESLFLCTFFGFFCCCCWIFLNFGFDLCGFF